MCKIVENDVKGPSTLLSLTVILTEKIHLKLMVNNENQIYKFFLQTHNK